MGFLDKLFKKKEEVKPSISVAESKENKLPVSTVEANAENNKKVKPTISAAEATELLREQFEGFAPVSGERNQKICDQFIAAGITKYADGSFDDATLSELTFDEFCHVYSTIGWFVENIASSLKENAILYKMFLRKKLLARLATFPLYTVNTQTTALPFVDADSSFFLYTNKAAAEVAVSDHTDWLEVFEITPERFNTIFCELFCTGYKLVNINGKTKVKIEDVYKTKPISTYGNICMESCVRMIDYKQTRASFAVKAAEEKRKEFTKDEADHLSRQSYAVSTSLLKDTLLVPAEQKNGKLIVSVPLVHFADGEQCVGLFTDQSAVNRYYKKAVSCVAFPGLIKDQYNNIKNNNTVSGILINPGREEYKMTKSMLEQLFSK